MNHTHYLESLGSYFMREIEIQTQSHKKLCACVCVHTCKDWRLMLSICQYYGLLLSLETKTLIELVLYWLVRLNSQRAPWILTSLQWWIRAMAITTDFLCGYLGSKLRSSYSYSNHSTHWTTSPGLCRVIFTQQSVSSLWGPMLCSIVLYCTI